MNAPWWKILLRDQQEAGFRDLAGADAAVTLPVSDRLLTSIVAARLPSSVPIRTIDIHAEGQDQFSVRLKLSAPAFLPAFTLRFEIVGQPEFPDSPIVACRMLSQGISAFVGPAMKLFASMPSWVRVEQDRVLVNLRLLAAQYGAADTLAFVRTAQVHTDPGRLVLSVRAGLPPDSRTAGSR